MGAAMNRKLATESTMLPVSNSRPCVPPVTQMSPTMLSPGERERDRNAGHEQAGSAA